MREGGHSLDTVKAVPGRKTDVRDAEWLAELLQHGLLRAICIPDRPQRELVDFLDQRITPLSAEIAKRLRPSEDDRARQDTIPGVSRRTAAVLLAESGTDLARFPTAGHLAS